MRLLDGLTEYEGRAEVFADGTWHTVCRDGFDETAGGRFCHQLGFDGLKELDTAHPLFIESLDMPPVFPDAIRCYGNETSLSTCRIVAEDLSACTHSNDTAIRCSCEHFMHTNSHLARLLTQYTLYTYVCKWYAHECWLQEVHIGVTMYKHIHTFFVLQLRETHLSQSL